MNDFDIIPALDLIGGRVVRLTAGDFATAKVYGTPEEILDAFTVPNDVIVHVVDLAGSRDGQPVECDNVKRIARRGVRVQVGGGVRTFEDAQRWFECGAERVVVGTVAAESPQLLDQLLAVFSADRIIAAVDITRAGEALPASQSGKSVPRDGLVRVSGWKRSASVGIDELFQRLEASGVRRVLVTDITRDGALRGPALSLYCALRKATRLRLIASGGIASLGDIVALSRLDNVGGCVVGKALLEKRLTIAEARGRIAIARRVPERIIPCLDVRDGRVVKGVQFTSLRDSGDPAACAQAYERDGADEIMLLDVSATDRGRTTAIDTVRRVAESIFVPLTVGGGVRTIEEFRALLRAGADRVAINTAAVRRPQLLREAAEEFGIQAVVLSCDAKRINGHFEVVVQGGSRPTGINVIDWCMQAEVLGAGEILLTSIDRDGTTLGFDLELLRAVTGAVRIGVIASGGAGTLDDFRDAIEIGGARAVLAASLFHERRLTVTDVKRHLETKGVPVRW